MSIEKDIQKLNKKLYEKDLIRQFVELSREFFLKDIDISDLRGNREAEARYIELDRMIDEMEEKRIA